MNTPSSTAPSNHSQSDAEEPAAEESVTAHAKRVVCTAMSTKLSGILDTGIGFLQKLRAKTGCPQDATEDEDRPGAQPERSRKQTTHSADAEDEADAPKPKRHLRAFLIYGSLILVGGIGGGALSYSLFQKQINHHIKETQRLNTALAQKTSTNAEIHKAFKAEQAKRTDAATKLAASLASATEKQKQLDTAEKQPSNPEPAGNQNSQEKPSSNQRGEGARSRPPKSGDCTLDAKNIESLKDCINNFNQ